MKWYEENYVDHVAWIVDHLEYLGLSYAEALLCLVLAFFKEKNLNITYELLGNKLDTSQDEIDKLLFGLKKRGYLGISVSKSGMEFDLSSLYEISEKEMSSKKDEDLFEMYEEGFKRPLSPNEMAKISSLAKKYGQGALIVALRAAQGHDKLNLTFVERYILNHESKDKDDR